MLSFLRVASVQMKFKAPLADLGMSSLLKAVKAQRTPVQRLYTALALA